jgi:hypothetical protein
MLAIAALLLRFRATPGIHGSTTSDAPPGFETSSEAVYGRSSAAAAG